MASQNLTPRSCLSLVGVLLACLAVTPLVAGDPPATAGGVDAATLSSLGIKPESQSRPPGPPVRNDGPWSWTTGNYTYDGAGNITGIGSQTFVYDVRGRLVEATVARPDQAGTQHLTYTFDAFGNMTERSHGTTTTSIPTAEATNHMTGATYDEAGNVTLLQTPGGPHQYAYKYDALSRLQEARAANVAGETRQLHIYTADDERIWTLDLERNESHWKIRDLGGKVLRDFKEAGTTWSLERDYVYRDGHLLAAVTPTRTLYYSLDHLGSPRVITDDNRQRVGFHHYLPFGQEWTDNTGAQEGERLKFTSHERDLDPAGETNEIDYMHARYYSADAGRFLSVDPVVDFKINVRKPKGWNRYVYVANNPARWTDPTGRVISYDAAFRQRVISDESFRQAFEAWKETASGAAQWRAMARDTNTVYTFSVHQVKVMTGPLRETEVWGATLPVISALNENKAGKLDMPTVSMAINADLIESNLRAIPAMIARELAKNIFHEATHGLDLGSGTRSAREALRVDPQWLTGTEPRLNLFERELNNILPPPDLN